MESLETVRGGKLSWEESFRNYGEHLLKRLQEARPTVPMIGRFRAPPSLHAYEELYFTIKERGRGLARLNPFSRKLVRVYEHRKSALGIPKTVTVFDSSLREDVTQIVPELNEKSGRHFDVRYA